ncbi:MAG: DUF86 domain-containing protein [Sulfuricaulis sp.]|uniref:HepT-like ribonuclease domain-containing protein n=1 Tax=Sulfuricaulis sp. TaxID=2003553 RepID=UPI0025F835F1|nr:HepT-like ribonuclease domain-containing protein [Sulfuricaulis sp.]MCR4345979.1 DUF86 domain-containing protein [Sulfuricaulis sp.]
MQHKAPKLLEDIRDSATFILEAVASLTLETYARDRIRRQAVERNFEIIGEALNRLSRVDPQVSRQIGPAPQIISFRNILVHGYDVVDHEVVWEIIRHELPELLKRAQQLLAEVGKETS